jgi:hypothetical protein
MSEISSTISPISCELSPRRLIRLDVSWICSRMSFMPEIEFCTARRPLSAAASERCATRAPSSAVVDTSEIDFDTCNTCEVVSSISRDCRSAAESSSFEIDCACAVFCVTWMAALFTPVTRFRSSSIV